MEHGREHTNQNISGKKLLFTTLLNFIITAAEVIGGILSNSLALLSDALHNLSDTVAVLLAWLASKIGERDPNEQNTFGYKRVEILAALFNAVVMAAISFYLFYEAYKRLMNPSEVKGLLMLIVAIIGLIANLVAVLLLKKDATRNLNVKAAYLHLLGDTLSSIAVIIGGILIYFFNINWIDPVITFIIGLYILKETWSILKESVNILMQAVPPELNLKKAEKDIGMVFQVRNIHHVHAWKLDDQRVHFECHVELEKNITISQTQPIKEEIEKLLHDKYNVEHVTLQFETAASCCEPKNLIHHG